MCFRSSHEHGYHCTFSWGDRLISHLIGRARGDSQKVTVVTNGFPTVLDRLSCLLTVLSITWVLSGFLSKSDRSDPKFGSFQTRMSMENALMLIVNDGDHCGVDVTTVDEHR